MNMHQLVNKKRIKLFLGLSLGIAFVAVCASLFYFDQSVTSNIRDNGATSTPKENLDQFMECKLTWPEELCSIFSVKSRKKLYEDCALLDAPKSVDDTVLYEENKIVVIHWWDEGRQDNVAHYLPYEPETQFMGCSSSSRRVLQHIEDTMSAR